MEDLTYITGNYGKYIAVKEKFERENIKIGYYTCDLEEPDINDIQLISKEKARQGYNLLGTPVFVADTGFYIENYPNNPGYPGAFVKRSGVSSNVDNLLKIMKEQDNRNCYFLDCLTFFDGKEYYQFFGISKGTLATEKRGNENKKALAEMSDEERETRPDNRTSATNEFMEWYKTNYKEKILIKKYKNNL